MNYLPIIKGQPIPEGADAADILAAGWTTGEVVAWARPLKKLYEPKEKEIATPPENDVPTQTSEKDDVISHLSDLGNAKRLVAKRGIDMRFCHLWEKWLIWGGQRWLKDDTGEAERRAKDILKDRCQDALEMTNGDERRALIKHILKSETASRIKSILALAESESGIPILPEQLDQDPWLLNCLNGTVDLRTGELLLHRREHYMTKLAPVHYDPDALCPTWDSFLSKIMDNNTNLINFLHRAAGYGLMGLTTEQVIFFLYGSGSNGKTTFIEAIRNCLGDYAQQMPTETLMVKQGDSIPNDIARLKGVRFVAATETEDGKRLSEVRVKQLTGGDVLTARFMRAEFFDFKPSHKLFIGTNHKPAIRGTDHAIWRRIRLVPFTVTIPDEEQDKQLLKKLYDERSGILAWLVRGCLDWQKLGLGMPDEVLTATNDYRKEMDTLAHFLEEKCVVVSDSSVRTKVGVLYEAYKKWSEASGEFQISLTKFGKQLTEHGIEKKEIDGRVWCVGIGLREDTGRETSEDWSPKLSVGT